MKMKVFVWLVVLGVGFGVGAGGLKAGWYCFNGGVECAINAQSCEGLTWPGDCTGACRETCGGYHRCGGSCLWRCRPEPTSCGGCSANCGGGTRTCTDSCNTWTESCNTHSCCTVSPWVNQACGIVTNGCGYETMWQTRTEACGGATSQCAANLTCPWPGSITGRKVVMPGNVTGVVGIADQTVTVDALTSAADPYTFSFADTNPGVTHAASVPTNALYDIGYTLCYNSTACHTGTITPGNTATVTEDGIRSGGANLANPYADLWWHYCPKLSEAQG
jgi:hypothetical protein